MPGSYLLLILILLIFGALVAGVMVTTLAFAVLRPPRLTDGRAIWIVQRLSPGDLGLKYEDIAFTVRDERTGGPLRIAGWWIPQAQANGRCVVLLHGLGEAKVSAIAWAPLWHSLGFNILAVDLRAHGESGGADSTAGVWERHDVSQVLDQIREQRKFETAAVVLFGVGLGAATAAATAALRDDLTAVVLESPPADNANAARLYIDRLGGPGRWFQSLVLRIVQRVAGSDYSAVRPVDLLGRITCPVMLIAPENDPMVSDDDRTAMEQALRRRDCAGKDAYWRLDGGDSLVIHAEAKAYEQKLREFLDGALDVSSVRGA
jgi:hypothetical protein